MTCLVGVGLEAVEDRRALVLRDLAVVLQRAVRGRAPWPALRSGSTHCEKTIALRPLSATSSMSASELFQLGALAGERVEVADLLEPHHQLEDVLHA